MDQWYYGKNGEQQGPVDIETIRSMLASGQLAQGDLVWKEGMANWTAISQIPDFTSQTQNQNVHQGGQGGYNTGGYQPVQPGYFTPDPQAAAIEKKATTAMILGIISIVTCICPLAGIGCGIPAIIMGFAAKNAPNKSQATAGIICGSVGIVLSIINAIAGVIMQLNKTGGGGF